MEHFEVIDEIEDIKTIAVSSSIREIEHLRKQYGAHRWRKLKAVTTVRLFGGRIRRAEVHWYEAHGTGTRMKIKRYLD